MNTAFLFFGGFAEIFLSLMLWFILDNDKQHAVLFDGNRVYPIAEVVAENLPTVNEDCEVDGQ